MSQTQGSDEVNRRENLETWSFLCMVKGTGRLRPPFLPERKSRELLAEQARPDQRFRNLVASPGMFPAMTWETLPPSGARSGGGTHHICISEALLASKVACIEPG